MNDNIKISKLLKRIISIYSKKIKKIKFDTLNKWRKIILITSKIKINKKHKLNHSNSFCAKSSNGFNRLYEDYKYKESYLEALKLLYQIKEGENCSFHPKTNKGFFANYNNNVSFLLNNKVTKLNRHKKNFLQDNYTKISNVLKYNRNNKISINKSINSSNSNSNYQNNRKQNDKRIFSRSTSFYNNLSKSLCSPTYQNKIDYYYNNFSDLNPKYSFNQNNQMKNYENPNVKINKRIKNKLNHNNSCKNINHNDYNIIIENCHNNKNKNHSCKNILPKNVFRFNSFQNINNIHTKTMRNKETKNLFLTRKETITKTQKNSIPKTNRNFSNSLIKYEILNSKNSKNHNLSKSIESYISKQKSLYSKKKKNGKNKNNSNSSISKNISNASTDKLSVVFDQLTVKAAYQQTTHVTLQTIPDEKILKMCNNYIETDESLEKFQKKRFINNKNNINYVLSNFKYN